MTKSIKGAESMPAYLKRNQRFVILSFLLPSLIGLLLFNIIPILYAFALSLSDWDGLKPLDIAGGVPQFVGVDNYADIVTGEELWRVLMNTFYFIVMYIPLILIASIFAAVLLNQTFKGIGIYRVLFYIPVLTSWVAGALIFKSILSPEYGGVNEILGYIGIEGPAWLYDEDWAMPGIVLASIWKDMGFFGLIFLGGLQGINPDYYEAASIDGASWWSSFTRITLPLLSPITFFVTIICIIFSFQLFPQVMIMTDAGPHGATQVMVERIYRYSFGYFKMGYASAFSFILFAIIFIFTWLQMKLQKKWVNYDA
jgi:multiple sugar transport system permease protein